MNSIQLAKQIDVVTELAQSIQAEWCRIVITYELEDRPDLLTQNTMLFYIEETASGLKKVGVKDPSSAVEASLLALNKAMADGSDQSWSSCEVVVDASGKYNFSFSYGPPKRINGVWDEESYFRYRNYLDTYKAELEAAKVG